MNNQKNTEARVDQLQQQQGTRVVRYRGVKAEMDLNKKHEKHTAKVSYRGAKADMDV